MSANPYDRRRGPRREGQAFAGMDLESFARVPAETPLTIRELEAMVYSAVRRGRAEAANQEVRAVGHAKREAWAEGHKAGREDLLADIARQHEERVADVWRRAAAMLSARKVSKSDLVAMLSETRAVLGQLSQAHHDGFVESLF